MLKTESFFDLSEFSHKDVFSSSAHVWDTLKNLKAYIAGHPFKDLSIKHLTNRPLLETLIYFEDELIEADQEVEIEFGDAAKGKLQVSRQGRILPGASVIMAGTVLDGGPLALGRGVLIEPGAYIKGPTIIDDYSEIRQGAYMRGYCLIGKRCVVGHVTEVKHTIFLNDAKAGHFAYLGDSILGNHVNLGAGTKLANLRFTGNDVPVRTPDDLISTGLRKLGAIMGDLVQTGCNSVTNPGTLLGKKSMLMPNTTAPSGYHPPNTLLR